MTQSPSNSGSTTSSSTTTGQNTCSVSNSLILPASPTTPAQNGWNGDIVVISGYNNSDSDTGQDYLQSSLTLLSFLSEENTANATPASAGNSLAIGYTGTLNLLPYTMPGSTVVNSVYNLLVSQANNYFPVAPVGEIGMKGVFGAVTVPLPSPCNSTSAGQAYIFMQNMMAYPSSPLAQQFTAALNNDNSSTPPTSASTNANNFFASTKNFANVTFAIYSAVTSYALAYAYIWANFQPSYTYNFYTVTPTSSDSSSAVGSTTVQVNEKVTSLGSVVFTQTGSLPASVSDANAGYTISWEPKGGSAVSLTFANGQLVDNNSDGFSSICLQCTFMDLAALTGNSADSGQTIQALTGLINGTNVIGSPVTLEQTVAEDIDQGLHEVLTSKVFEALEIGLALYQGIEVAVKLGCWIKAKVSKGTPPTEEEIQTTESSLQTEAQDRLADAGNTEPVETGSSLVDAQVADQSTALNAEAEGNEDAEIQNQYTEEESQLELENNPAIDEEVATTNTELSDLQEVNPASADASASIGSIQTEISSNQQSIDTQNEALGEASSAEVQQENATIDEEETDEETDEKEEAEDEDGDADAADDLGDVADL